ncbi:EamA family transporter RarD [Alkaliphilus pronyensis]|uniref:EamA family transporter RarD n=1 Tax=Alkaliphilus pronyensis TaxID=1482732 RepID=A0A6I0FFH5_9FIRM|nr:EamA family transporter RarD [Alkaliphilus pronyensis]KAB3539042.1 EamA family transporter RarD [Alkaliphilus pronyensis]
MENQASLSKNDNKKIGILYGTIAFIAWGFLPLYWKLLNQIPALEILAHRITWSFVFVTILLLLKGDFKRLKEVFKSRKNTVLIIFASVFITVNWFTYIWSVNSNYVVQASMGYYINPLVVSLLSMLVLKERFNAGQMIALILATIGVLVLTIQYGRIPWIALILATTFAFYGLTKKLLTVDSITGLALETMIITPAALSFIIYRQVTGVGSLSTIPIPVLILLMLSGVATATPLLWFAKGAQMVELSTIGFLQYIAPTISLFLGIFLFKEEFSQTHFISFSFIWVALIIYTISITRGNIYKIKEKSEAVSAKKPSM